MKPLNESVSRNETDFPISHLPCLGILSDNIDKVGSVVKRFNTPIFTTSLGNVRLHDCLGPPGRRLLLVRQLKESISLPKFPSKFYEATERICVPE